MEISEERNMFTFFILSWAHWKSITAILYTFFLPLYMYIRDMGNSFKLGTNSWQGNQKKKPS